MPITTSLGRPPTRIQYYALRAINYVAPTVKTGADGLSAPWLRKPKAMKATVPNAKVIANATSPAKGAGECTVTSQRA